MIVYPAYIYMGDDGGPVNPVIFQKNEINYNYSGTNFTETSEGFEMTGFSELMFTGLDLSNFIKLAVKAKNRTSRDLTLTVNFIDNSGNVSANITKTFRDHMITENQYDIPAEYRNPRTKIKISTPHSYIITLQYAILS